jgi:SMODS-associating 2TM, beta-strand rich effector domain
MHAYASDSLDRNLAPWMMAVCAVGVAYLYVVLSRTFQYSLPWWFETPSIMLVYGLFHWVYDSHLWKLKVRGIALSQIPDFSGTWYGELRSSHDEGSMVEGMLIVHQTWTRIVIEFRTDSSTSFSRMASLNVAPGASQGLIYEYSNDPRGNSRETMHAHRGFTFLTLSADGKWLEGDYYTGRDRTNFGTMRLRLVSRKQLDLQEAKRQYSRLKKGAA